MKKKKIFKLLVSLALTFFVAVFIIVFSKSKVYQILELKALDVRFALKSNTPTHTQILHIDIDDQSLAQLGRWPWTRSHHAKLIDTLTECGAEQIIMDLLFMEEVTDLPQEDVLLAKAMSRSDRVYLPFYFTKDRKPASAEFTSLLLKDITIPLEEAARILNQDPDSCKDEFSLAKRSIMDQALREVLGKNPEISINGVFEILENSKGWFLFSEEEAYLRKQFQNKKLAEFFADKFALDHVNQKTLKLEEFKTISVPIKEYIKTMKDSGFINADPDADGVLRRIPLFIKYEDKIFSQLSLAALIDSFNISDVEFKNNFIILNGAHIQSKIRNITIPVDESGCMLVNWTGRWGHSFKHIPYYRILKLHKLREQLRTQLKGINAEEQVSSENAGIVKYLRKAEANLKEELTGIVKNRICIVGLTATGTQDMGPIPLQTDYPLVGTHSNLINTIITEDFIGKAPPCLNVFIFFFTALLIGFASLIRLWRSLLFSVCYAVGYFLIAFFAFDKLGLWIDLVGPLGIVVFGFSGIMSLRFFTEEREKIWIKKAFSHYLPQDVINELIEDPSKLKLGGERRIITVLFSDIKSFTTYSEKKAPEEVVSVLNEYLDVMTKVIFDNKGTLDKYMGDGIMAIFGAPHYEAPEISAKRAVKTAWQMMEKLKALQDEWIKRGYQPLDIGIGINTGEMIVGNMGSTLVMDYTVIGDAVNLGARIETLTRRYNNNIMISEFTYKYIKKIVDVNPLEPIKVKGKDIPVMMYEVTGVKLD